MSQHQNTPFYLAMDQGGHSTRAIVFNQTGEVVYKARRSVSVQNIDDNKVEQSALELAVSLHDVLNDVAQALTQLEGEIVACGLATQRSNVVCWDNYSGEALSAALSWQDRRAHAWLRQFEAQRNEIHARTGLLLSAHYGASKLRWCIDHLPEVSQALQQQRLHMGPLASYLIAQTCGVDRHFIDPANASRTLLWNLHDKDWDDFLLRLFNVPKAVLPKCVPTLYPYGDITVGRQSIPLTVVNGDQSAALFADGKPDIDAVYINLGTGAFLQCTTFTYIIRIAQMLSSIVYYDGVHAGYVLECTVNGAGSALSGIEQQLGIDTQHAEAHFSQWLNQLTDIPLFLNGVSGLGAPYWVADFKSRFIGEGGAAEKIVAVAESILFLLQDNLRLLTDNKIRVQRLVLTGGLAQTDALCQRLADLSGMTVLRPEECEATARGTAYLAANMPRQWNTLAKQRFAPQQNDPLHNRYNAWRGHMQTALREYSAL